MPERIQTQPWDFADSLIACGLALAASLALAFALMPGSIGLSEDSWSYQVAAHHLAQGEGFSTGTGARSQPLLRWPPGYPLLLAPGTLTPIGIEAWAALQNIVLFATLIVSVFALLRWACLGRVSALTGAVLVFCAHGTLFQYGMLLSEGPFLPMELALIALLVVTLEKQGALWLVTAGVIVACATLTRYAGQGLIVGGLACVFFYANGSWRRKFFSATLFIVAAQIPVLMWLLRNYWLSGSATGLGFEPRAPEFEPLFNFWRVMTVYWLPEGLQRWFRHVGMIALIAIGVFCIRQGWSELPARSKALCKASGAILLGYITFLMFTLFTSGAAPDVDLRMLLPAMLPLALMFAISTQAANNRARPILSMLILLLILIGLIRLAQSIESIRTKGPYTAWLEH